MKALNVRQPWASLILAGRKTIELRSWATRYRGPLVIVASRGPDWHALARKEALDGPRGVILAHVALVDVRPVRLEEDAADALGVPMPGDYAWVLARPRALDQVAVRGRLGLYDLDPSLVREFAA
jgi:hypothetical protein